MNLFRKKQSYYDNPIKQNLHRCLNAFDLTFLGIGAIIGAGIFVITGVVAAVHTGPAIILSYVVAGLACLFSALSYAELAAAIGGCGSAYGYVYVGFGELMAWIIGWDLLLEYAVSVATVAVGWSSYLHQLLSASPLHIATFLLKNPIDGGVVDLTAMLVVIALSFLLIYGIKSSARFNHLMVVVKLAVIVLFIVIAANHVNVHHWIPFMPFGWIGVMQGASLIFFAYIGFDAISTAAEEVMHPQRNLPIGIIASLLISTLLYILVSGLLTGIVSYRLLNVASPISQALLLIGEKTAAGFVGIGSLAGLTTVMLVMFYGLTRVFLAMSRDGLLPHFFSQVSPITQTPIRIIVFCMIFIAPIAGLLPIHDLAELVNIGTLVAFMMVCGGVLILDYKNPQMERPFKTPGKPYVPILGVLICFYLILNLSGYTILRFIIWFALGLVIYFTFSYQHSVLNRE